MAEVTFIAPVAKIEGKLNQKDKTVFRKKVARDDQGRVIAEMKQEVYVVQHPRDWKKKPAKGAEKLKQERWAEASAKTKAILDNPELRSQWELQWQAQLKKAEADAPIDPRTKRRKIYIKFDCYVRSKVWRGLA
mgnify:FL=1